MPFRLRTPLPEPGLVIGRNFDVVGIRFSPHKTYSILAIDANAMLPLSITSQRLQMISRRVVQISEQLCTMKHEQFSKDDLLQLSILAAWLPIEYLLRLLIRKATDHALEAITLHVIRHPLYPRLLTGTPDTRTDSAQPSPSSKS